MWASSWRLWNLNIMMGTIVLVAQGAERRTEVEKLCGIKKGAVKKMQYETMLTVFIFYFLCWTCHTPRVHTTRGNKECHVNVLKCMRGVLWHRCLDLRTSGQWSPLRVSASPHRPKHCRISKYSITVAPHLPKFPDGWRCDVFARVGGEKEQKNTGWRAWGPFEMPWERSWQPFQTELFFTASKTARSIGNCV